MSSFFKSWRQSLRLPAKDLSEQLAAAEANAGQHSVDPASNSAGNRLSGPQYERQLERSVDQYFRDENQPAIVRQLWIDFLDFQHDADAQSRLRKFILGLSPLYRTGWTTELCGNEKRAATFPIVSNNTLETLLQRFEQSKQVFVSKEFSIVELDEAYLLEEISLLQLIAMRPENRALLFEHDVPGSVFQAIKWTVLRGIDAGSSDYAVREYSLLFLFNSLRLLEIMLLQRASKDSSSVAAFESSNTDSTPIQLSENLRSSTFLTICELIRLMKKRTLNLHELEVLSATVRIGRLLLLQPVAGEWRGVLLEQFLESKTMQELVTLIGWPENILPQLDPISFPDEVGVVATFKLQQSILELVEQGFNLPQISHRWSAIGGFQRMMDFIFWVGTAFATGNTPTLEAVDLSVRQLQAVASPFIQQPDHSKILAPNQLKTSTSTIATPAAWMVCNVELDAIFQIILRMCLIQSSPDAVLLASQLKLPNANRTTLLVLLDLFNEEIRQTKQNLIARRLIRFVFPELQLFLLRLLVLFYSDHLASAPLSSWSPYQAFGDCGVWEVLSGPFFLASDPEATAAILEYLPLDLAREAEETRSVQVSQYLNRELKRYFFAVLEFFASSSAPSKEQNNFELAVLLSVAEKYKAEQKHLDMCLNAVSCILRVLQAQWLVSIQAMLALNGCARLSILLSFVVDKTSQENSNAAIYIQIRNIMLRCVNMLLSSSTTLPSVMADGKSLDMLFRVLMDRELRPFAMVHLISIMKSDAAFIRANEELFFKLFERYLDTMLKAAESESALADPSSVSLLLLNGIVTILDVKDCYEHQTVFCTAGAFIKITSLIHIAKPANGPADGGSAAQQAHSHVLCLAVIRALTFLMAGNEENKDFFAKHIGYDQLKELILISFNHKLPRMLLTSLFDLMMDGKLMVNPRSHVSDDGTGDVFFDLKRGFQDDDESVPADDPMAAISAAAVSAVRNPSIASLLLKLVSYLRNDDQELLFEFLIKLASHSSLNRTRLCNEGILFQLLGMIPKRNNAAVVERIMKLITLLGQHSITVREVNRMISLLKPLQGDLRPPWIPAVLDVMQSMAESPQSPFPVYFDFDGVKSALVLPALPKWPLGRTGTSFTVVSWLCIESFSDPMGAPNYQPRLFSFLDDEGSGMEAFFQNGYLNFQVIAPSPTVTAPPPAQGTPVAAAMSFAQRTEKKCFTQFVFKPKVWYCIAFTYNVISRLMGRFVEVKLHVDGKFVGKDVMKVTPSLTNLSRCRVGSNAVVNTPEHASVLLRENSLFGQMAEIVFFDTELDLKQLESLRVGSRIDPTGIQTGTADGASSEHDNSAATRGEWANMFDGPAAPTAKPIMYFSPRASSSIKHAISAGILTQQDCADGATALCFDASPYARDAFLTFGLNMVQRRHLKEIIGCINGGVKAVFPVLLLLDKQEADAQTDLSTVYDSISKHETLEKLSSAQRTTSSGAVDSATDSQLQEGSVSDDPHMEFNRHSGAAIAVQTVKFVCRILVGARDLQQDMRAHHGFMLMAFLLLKVSPKNLSAELLDTLFDTLCTRSAPPASSGPADRLAPSATESSEHSNTLPEHLHDDIIRYILLDFHLWIYAAPAVQRYLLTEILPKVLSARTNLRGRYGLLVAQMLDSARTFYWSVPTPDSMAVDPIINPTTRKIVAQRPGPTALRLLRQGLLELMDQIVHPEITLEETREILAFLLESKDSELSVDVLRFLHKLIQVDASCLQQLRSIGLEVFLILLDNKSSRVRSQALAVIQATLLAQLKVQQGQTSSALGSLTRPRSLSSSITSLPELLEALFPPVSIQEFLSSHKLDQATYNALFAIVVGQRRPAAKITSTVEQQHQAAALGIDVDDTTEIKVPSLLQVILKLATLSAESKHLEPSSPSSLTESSSSIPGADRTALVEQALQDLYLLLTVRPENREELHNAFGWQLWLLECVSLNEGEAKRVVFDLSVNIFKVMFIHRMQKKGGHSFLLELENFVRIGVDKGLKGQPEFYRHFIRLVCMILKKDLAVLSAENPDPQRIVLLKDIMDPKNNKYMVQNLANAIFFLIEYMYFMDMVIVPNAHTATTNPATASGSAPSLAAAPTPPPGSPIWERQDPTRITSSVTDPSLVDDLYAVMLLLESVPGAWAQSVTGSSSAALLSAKKAQFRGAGSIPVLYRLAMTKLYHSDDLKGISDCLQDILSRLTKSGTKIAEAYFVFYHALNSLTSSRQTTPTWTMHLRKVVFPFVGELFQNFKPHFFLLKQFNEMQLAYIEQIRAESELDLGSPLLVSILTILRSKLGDVEKDDANSVDSVVKSEQKAYKVVWTRWRRGIEQESETVQRIGNSVLQVQQVFATRSSSSEHKRLVSNAILAARYRRAARQWRKVLRGLKNERGPWGTKDMVVHWKLDRTENFMRMRLKMKRNYNFNDHRDAVRAPTSGAGVVPESPEDVLKSVLPAVRKDFLMTSPEFEVSRPDLSKVDLEDQDSDSLAGSGTMASSSTPGGQPPSNEALQPEKLVFITSCEMIRPMRVIKGVLEITNVSLKFRETPQSEYDKAEELKEKTWSIDSIREIHLRRYLLVQSALEVFMMDHTAILFNFNKKDRNRVYNKLIRLNPRGLTYRDARSPEDILRTSDLTKKWQLRLISNFEYLMHLNTLAGRTYNDLCQYPVFPWILSDYTSEQLDLNKSSVYRDLSKPVGALNPTRLEQFIERYKCWTEVEESPPFLYGTHYSSAAVVLFYLIRMEPFTTHAIKLQGGKFDHGDRLFHSIPQCWSNCLTSTADVKELTPEFFYCPEFLDNQNEFNLGKRHTGEPIINVQLPPWASSPEDFIRINRQALESDYVSAHLHEWIDLIFGHKQKGQPAIDSNNVFHYLTYEGSIDIESITEPIKRQATELTIAEFGQTPSQLFRKPHPSRNALSGEIPQPIGRPSSVVLSCQTGDGRLIWVAPRRQDVACVDQIGRIKFVHIPMLHQLTSSSNILDSSLASGTPLSPTSRFSSSVFRQASQTFAAALGTVSSPSSLLGMSSTAGGLPTSPHMIAERQTRDYTVLSATTDNGNSARLILPHLNEYRRFALSFDGAVLFTAHEDDFSIRTTLLDSLRAVQIVVGHKDAITCMALTEDGSALVTGSKDTSLLVWNLVNKGGVSVIDENPRHVLNGHEDQVTSVAVHAELDLCVSGSRDRTCNIYSLRTGEYVRSIYLKENGHVDSIVISSQGYLVIYSKAELSLHLYSINGKYIRSADAFENLNHVLATRDGEFLISGGKKGWVFIRSLFDLKVVQKHQLQAFIWSLAISWDERHILVGLDNGQLVIIECDFAALARLNTSAVATSRGRIFSATSTHVMNPSGAPKS